MPLVRSDGLPTQHMRALAYWAAAPELDDCTSLQVCGTEWVSHVTCRRQLLDALAMARSNGTRTRSPTATGAGGPPTYDVFHGMVARRNEAVSSSKQGALLIDDMVEWARRPDRRRPGAGRGAAGAPAARAGRGAGDHGLVPADDDLERGRVRAGAPVRAGAQPRLGHRRRPGARGGGAGRRRGAGGRRRGVRWRSRRGPRLPLRRRPVGALPPPPAERRRRPRPGAAGPLPLPLRPLVRRRGALAAGRRGRPARCSTEGVRGLGLEAA